MEDEAENPVHASHAIAEIATLVLGVSGPAAELECSAFDPHTILF